MPNDLSPADKAWHKGLTAIIGVSMDIPDFGEFWLFAIFVITDLTYPCRTQEEAYGTLLGLIWLDLSGFDLVRCTGYAASNLASRYSSTTIANNGLLLLENSKRRCSR
jgi:hypothetical protein